MANDGFARWCQVVRSPGAFQIHVAHSTLVPPEGGATASSQPRPGVRLLGQPIQMVNPAYAIDMTSTAGMAMLEGFLAMGHHVNREISWSSRGWGVRRRDTIRLAGR
jgi:hypothetical protein